jgi:hypothetical protein
MARKFRIINLRTPQRKLPNRCLLCGRVIGGSNIRSNIHSDTNPTEKIKEIEKEIVKIEDKWKSPRDDTKWNKRNTEFFVAKAKLQVYKEWEEREAEILEIIEKQLKENHNNLKNKNLPNMSQANLSGMIIALEILKSKIKGENLK